MPARLNPACLHRRPLAGGASPPHHRADSAAAGPGNPAASVAGEKGREWAPSAPDSSTTSGSQPLPAAVGSAPAPPAPVPSPLPCRAIGGPVAGCCWGPPGAGLNLEGAAGRDGPAGSEPRRNTNPTVADAASAASAAPTSAASCASALLAVLPSGPVKLGGRAPLLAPEALVSLLREARGELPPGAPPGEEGMAAWVTPGKSAGDSATKGCRSSSAAVARSLGSGWKHLGWRGAGEQVGRVRHVWTCGQLGCSPHCCSPPVGAPTCPGSRARGHCSRQGEAGPPWSGRSSTPRPTRSPCRPRGAARTASPPPGSRGTTRLPCRRGTGMGGTMGCVDARRGSSSRTPRR
jgi:hypothetical protein